MSPGADRLLWPWMLIMIVFCPTIYHALKQSNADDLIIDDNIDFWYDSLNDCYRNQMPSIWYVPISKLSMTMTLND